MAQAGYLQIDRALSICVFYSSSRSLLEQMSLTLCSNELMMLYLFDMALVAVPLKILVGVSGLSIYSG